MTTNFDEIKLIDMENIPWPNAKEDEQEDEEPILEDDEPDVNVEDNPDEYNPTSDEEDDEIELDDEDQDEDEEEE